MGIASVGLTRLWFSATQDSGWCISFEVSAASSIPVPEFPSGRGAVAQAQFLAWHSLLLPGVWLRASYEHHFQYISVRGRYEVKDILGVSYDDFRGGTRYEGNARAQRR